MRGMGFNKDRSKAILTKLLVLEQHLDRLRNIPKPRDKNVDVMIEAIHARIEREKKKLRGNIND
jgi:hypothetical protein